MGIVSEDIVRLTFPESSHSFLLLPIPASHIYFLQCDIFDLLFTDIVGHGYEFLFKAIKVLILVSSVVESLPLINLENYRFQF